MAIVAALLCCGAPARAHVGSPDVYAEGQAGPYKLFVTIRPPLVIPGVAEINVRADSSASTAITGIDITPIPLAGEASKHPPIADSMKQSAPDKQFFTGTLWIMATGSWQVRFLVHGSQGDAVLSIPLPATARGTLGMHANLGIVLGVLGLFLILGMVGIVGAAVQDAQLAPGGKAPEGARRRAAIAKIAAFVVTTGILIFGYRWWTSDARQYSANVYKPLTMQASLSPDYLLKLNLEDPGWIKSRKTDDFVLDHDHLMHLYMIREPGMDVVFHLHPDQVAPGQFQLALPSVPAGNYRLYADVVHATGFPETLVASITLPAIPGRPLGGDDAEGTAQPIPETASCAAPASEPKFKLPDGYTMVWTDPAPQPARTPEIFEFSLLGPDGKPPVDMSLYMGMLGHAAFVKTDGSVFAHVHPSGTVSMAALMMAAAQNQTGPNQSGPNQPGPNQPPQALPQSMAMASMPGMDMSGMDMSGMDKPGTPAAHRMNATASLPNSVGFPYGFPTPGQYRVFVQMKHGSTVETAAFDACAGAPQAK